MKKYKFSEKLPICRKLIFCKIRQRKEWMCPFGLFHVYTNDIGIKLVANADFIKLTDKATRAEFDIHFGEKLSENLLCWADPEEWE